MYLCVLALAEMFGSVRIKSNRVEVTGGVKNMQFKTVSFCNLQLHLTEPAFLHIQKKKTILPSASA